LTAPARFRLAILASHVIQYQDPLFQRLASNAEIDLTVYYCSKAGAERYFDADMGTSLEWDIPLLQGYRHVFLPNWSPGSLEGGAFRFINPSIAFHLRNDRPDALLLMVGWASVTSWIAITAARTFGIPLLMYGDSSFIPESEGVRALLRDRVIRSLFSSASAFMITGTFNADYYLHYGADRTRFFPMPWAIDVERFASSTSPEERRKVRNELGIEADKFVVLYSGKLIARKNPLHLIEAVARSRYRDRCTVLYLGDGVERHDVEQRAGELGVDARFTGFRNQSQLPRLIAAADAFVLPSSFDPRGTVTNEAMAASVPVLVSENVGVYGAGDLVEHGESGFVFKLGDHQSVAGIIDRLIDDPEFRTRITANALARVAAWNFDADIEGILQASQFIKGGMASSKRPPFLEGSAGQR